MHKYVLLLIFLVASPTLSFAHGGGLDSNGGHYNRRTGEYHYHRRSPVKNPPSSHIQKMTEPAAKKVQVRGASPGQTPPVQVPKGAAMADEIKKLYELYKQGVLSKEEYEQGKRKLLE